MTMHPEGFKQTLQEITAHLQHDEPIHSQVTSEDLYILYSLGYSLYEAGNYEQAKKVFFQMISAKPLEQKYWIGLASTLQMNQEYKAALKGWSMAALIDDHDPIPHFHAAECLFSLQEIEDGKKALQEAKARLENTQNEQDLKNQIESLEQRWEKEE